MYLAQKNTLEKNSIQSQSKELEHLLSPIIPQRLFFFVKNAN